MVTILKASSIITMDPSKPRAEAVAFDESTKRIVEVGTLAECQSAIRGARTRDLGDAVLLPGFVEAHSHPVLSGMATQPPVHWIAPYVSGAPQDWGGVQELFGKIDRETPAGQAVFFSGLDRMLQEGTPMLDARLLDGYFPDRPAAVLDNSGHAIYFNTALMKRIGWDAHPPEDPVGGSFSRLNDGISLSGVANEVQAATMVIFTQNDEQWSLVNELIKHPLLSSAEWYKLMADNGITSTSEMTYKTEQLQAYMALATPADCPLRISLYHMSTEEDAADDISAPLPEGLLTKQGVKLWADGSPWVGTAALSFPYRSDSDVVIAAGIDTDRKGEDNLNYSRQQLEAIVDRYAPGGWQMASHANGDLAIELVLDVYERALKKHDLIGTDHRWRLEHCGAGRREHFERAAGLGVTVSQGPFQFIYWGDLLDGELFPEEVTLPDGGAWPSSHWMAFRDAVDAGVRPSFHNDGSVSPPEPLLNVQSAITRSTRSGRVHGPGQIISLDDALAAQTTNPAWQLKRDHEIGSIVKGKYADFVELSMDPYEADPTKFADQVKVTGTWLGGHRVDTDRYVREVKRMDSAPHRHLSSSFQTCCCSFRSSHEKFLP